MRNQSLWDAIRAHPLPADAAGRSFEDQLRDEHKISRTTANRAIEEYRRFIYLSALGDGRSVPSKAVDAVWHLHLTHTRDYWQKFIPDALGGRSVHHEPGTPAGHSGDYSRTIARYQAEFGTEPPKGIWAKANRGGGILMAAFGGLWTFGWCAGAMEAGQPLFALLGLAVGGSITLYGMGLAFPGLGIEFGIDIWSDSEGGDCGSCGGGCGD